MSASVTWVSRGQETIIGEAPVGMTHQTGNLPHADFSSSSSQEPERGVISYLTGSAPKASGFFCSSRHERPPNKAHCQGKVPIAFMTLPILLAIGRLQV